MLRLKSVLIIMCVLMLTLTQGCLNENFQPEIVDNCDTTTYQRIVKPIILKSCALSGCHDGSNSNPDYNKYLEVKKEVDTKINGVPQFLYRIDLPVSDEKHMPQNGIILSLTDRLQIKKWIDSGYYGCDQ